jgi:molybdenum cofactor cytidylyltransferase
MISAIVLAAGQSRRMGKPKINLSWGDTTILGFILHVLDQAGVDEIIVVIGDIQPQALPEGLAASMRITHNPEASKTEMLTSLQVGIRCLSPESDAFLVVLGDQPQIQRGVIQELISTFHGTGSEIIVPSYKMRRGHPWLASRRIWKDILALEESQTLRSFLADHNSKIFYLNVQTDSILKDIDTPEDYRNQKPSTRNG